MSTTLLIIIILTLVVLFILFLVNDTPTVIKHKITLKELQRLHYSHPPILVTTIKNGRMQETLCYFSTKEHADEPQVMEIIPDHDFILKYKWREKRLNH